MSERNIAGLIWLPWQAACSRTYQNAPYPLGTPSLLYATGTETVVGTGIDGLAPLAADLNKAISFLTPIPPDMDIFENAYVSVYGIVKGVPTAGGVLTSFNLSVLALDPGIGGTGLDAGMYTVGEATHVASSSALANYDKMLIEAAKWALQPGLIVSTEQFLVIKIVPTAGLLFPTLATDPRLIIQGVGILYRSRSDW